MKLRNCGRNLCTIPFAMRKTHDIIMIIVTVRVARCIRFGEVPVTVRGGAATSVCRRTTLSSRSGILGLSTLGYIFYVRDVKLQPSTPSQTQTHQSP